MGTKSAKRRSPAAAASAHTSAVLSITLPPKTAPAGEHASSAAPHRTDTTPSRPRGPAAPVHREPQAARPAISTQTLHSAGSNVRRAGRTLRVPQCSATRTPRPQLVVGAGLRSAVRVRGCLLQSEPHSRQSRAARTVNGVVCGVTEQRKAQRGDESRQRARGGHGGACRRSSTAARGHSNAKSRRCPPRPGHAGRLLQTEVRQKPRHTKPQGSRCEQRGRGSAAAATASLEAPPTRRRRAPPRRRPFFSQNDDAPRYSNTMATCRCALHRRRALPRRC